ncbi:unnamed protein product [Merluccius merluccius]
MMQRADGMKSSIQPEMPPEAIDIHDIIQHKDESLAEKSRVLTGRLLQNPLYRFLVRVVIISDCVILGIQIDRDRGKDHATVLSMLEHIIHSVFIWEIAIKWYYSFGLFWLSGWNCLDFVFTLSVILGPMLFPDGGVILLKVMRVLRVLRSAVGILAIRRLAETLKVIVESIPDIGAIFLLLVIILLLFAVCGVNMFRASHHFSNLGTALYTLFTCLTQDGWVVIFREFRGSDIGMEYYGGALYFIVFIGVGGFLFANLFATLTSNLAPDDVADEIPEFDFKEVEEMQEVEEMLEEEGGVGEETMTTNQDGWLEPCSPSTINDTLQDIGKNLSEYDQLQQELKR